MPHRMLRANDLLQLLIVSLFVVISASAGGCKNDPNYEKFKDCVKEACEFVKPENCHDKCITKPKKYLKCFTKCLRGPGAVCTGIAAAGCAAANGLRNQIKCNQIAMEFDAAGQPEEDKAACCKTKKCCAWNIRSNACGGTDACDDEDEDEDDDDDDEKKSAGSQGDPHLTTFDGLYYDCQVGGEFDLIESDIFQAQARFEKHNNKVAVTTAVVAIEKTHGKKKKNEETLVQISLIEKDPADTVLINGCPYQLYVGGKPVPNGFGHQDDKLYIVRKGTGSTGWYVRYFETGISLDVEIHSAPRCYLNVRVKLPKKWWSTPTSSTLTSGNTTISGLLGTPDDNPFNDWLDRDGNVIDEKKDGSCNPDDEYSKNRYCAKYWCIKSKSKSLFKYPEKKGGYDFHHYSQCTGKKNKKDKSIDFSKASEEVRALCGTDTACLIDGIVMGIDAANDTLVSERQATRTSATLYANSTEGLVFYANFEWARCYKLAMRFANTVVSNSWKAGTHTFISGSTFTYGNVYGDYSSGSVTIGIPWKNTHYKVHTILNPGVMGIGAHWETNNFPTYEEELEQNGGLVAVTMWAEWKEPSPDNSTLLEDVVGDPVTLVWHPGTLPLMHAHDYDNRIQPRGMFKWYLRNDDSVKMTIDMCGGLDLEEDKSNGSCGESKISGACRVCACRSGYACAWPPEGMW